jgi:hypothetical protein
MHAMLLMYDNACPVRLGTDGTMGDEMRATLTRSLTVLAAAAEQGLPAALAAVGGADRAAMLTAPFHPNVTGQRNLAELVVDTLGGPSTRGTVR